MKKIYTLNQSLMNGTVTMNILSSSYSTKELAEKVRDDLKVKNKDFAISFNIQETVLYDSEDEVPCLNEET